MDQATCDTFIARIRAVKEDSPAEFGRMNAQQMLVHCTDQLRVAMEQMVVAPMQADPREIIALAKAGKPIETPKGMDQVKGEGTAPTSFEEDRDMLIDLLKEYQERDPEAHYADHPYFGPKDKAGWNKMVIYHLNHHLGQFGV